MKTIGKIAALAMTLSLALVLSACGGNAASSSASASSSAASGSSAASAAASSASSSASSTSTADAKVYTNDAFGIEFNLIDGWAFQDPSNSKNSSTSVMTITEGEAIDMLALSDDGKTGVIVGIVSPNEETKGMTADDMLKKQTEAFQNALKEANTSFTSSDAEVTFEGISRKIPASITTINAEGSTGVIGIAVAEQDGYFMDIMVTGTNEDDVLNAFKNFKATRE